MKRILILLAMALLAACTQQKFEYPETRKTDTVDNYFGTLVPDPYRWLEDDRSPETEAWVEAQNKVTFAYLEKIPYRERVKERLTELINYPKSTAPWKEGKYYFVEKNDGLQNQDVYFVMDGIDDEPRVFIDPNTLSGEGTVAVTSVRVSGDNRYAAYGVARAGSDWKEIYVRDMETGEDLKDHVMWTKFAEAAWHKDGFFYSRFDEPAQGEELSGRNLNNRVYFHRIGTDQSEDRMVYFNPGRNDLTYIPLISRGSPYLILYAFESTSGNAILVADLTGGDWKFREVLEGFKYNYNPVGVIGDRLYLRTDRDAGKYRIVAVDLKNGSELTDIVPEQEERVISGAYVAKDKLVVKFMKDARDLLGLYRADGTYIQDIELPGPGTIEAVNTDKDDNLVFFTFESFTTPPMVFKYDLETCRATEYFKTEIDFDGSEYITQQVFYSSKDGTRIPMFIVHREDVKLDGNNPLLLWGYGGFNVTEKPNFKASRIVWFENGGIYALANIRGGGEYGEEWHKAGMVLNKQNVFDDFIAAAEYLIEEG